MTTTPPLTGSMARVHDAASAAQLAIEILEMPASTRTAAEAASACNCDIAQIVKSLVFQGKNSKNLLLLLVAGNHQANMELAEALIGEPLTRADPRRVRDETGFAIGGVAPIGHKIPIPTYMDESLLAHKTVYAAAGKPNALFAVDPAQLLTASAAVKAKLA